MIKKPKVSTYEKNENDTSWYNDNESALILKLNTETILKCLEIQKHYIFLNT